MGAMTLRIMTFSIPTFSINCLFVTISITTLRIKHLFETLGINDNQHKSPKLYIMKHLAFLKIPFLLSLLSRSLVLKTNSCQAIPGKSDKRGRLSKVDLLELTS